METGVVQIAEGGDSFRIFDIEKTVVDIIYYRNKIGIEETSEVLRNYLKRKDRQIDRLYTYAKTLPFLLAWCVLYRPQFILFCTP